jgi:glucose/mannose-6-phosphate isomerase
MNHNEIVGWELLRKVLRKFAVIFIRDKQDNSRIKKRIAITKKILSKRANWVGEAESTGKSSLARLFSLIYLGDYISVYLSLLYGIDPTPIKVIEDLKKELAG